MPLVSIIIPCRNAVEYVKEAIDSALNQTYKNIEVIVVDDGSSDGSSEVIQSFSDRIRILPGPERGVSAARNLGLLHARGQFVQFHDADDVLHPDKVEKQIPHIIKGKADVTFCRKSYMNKAGELERTINKVPDPVGMDSFVYCVNNNSPGDQAIIDTIAPLHKKEFLDRVGGFREGLKKAEDKELILRLTARGARLHLVDEILYKIRNHDNTGRATNQKYPIGYPLELLINIASNLATDDSFDFSMERKQALANKMFSHAQFVYRGGDKALAIKGHEYAKKLYHDITIKGGWKYRILYKTLGFDAAEKVVSLLSASR